MKYIISLIALILLISCNNQAVKQETKDNDPVIATWRGGQITLKEFEDFVLYYVYNNDSVKASKISYDERRKLLNDIIQFRLVSEIAESLKIDTMKTMRESYRRKLAGISYKHFLYIDSIRNKVFNESDILNEYKNMLTEVRNSIGSYESERQRIINTLSKRHKNKLDSVQNKFQLYLFHKYGVIIKNESFTTFLDQFNCLLRENTDLSSVCSKFDNSILLSEFQHDSIMIKDILNYFSKIDKSATSSISESDLNNLIFIKYFNKLIFIASEDMGYTKYPEVIKTAKEGMIIDYLEYLTGGFFNDANKMKKWRKNLLKNYNSSIQHSVLEKSFLQPSDDRK